MNGSINISRQWGLPIAQFSRTVQCQMEIHKVIRSKWLTMVQMKMTTGEHEGNLREFGTELRRCPFGRGWFKWIARPHKEIWAGGETCTRTRKEELLLCRHHHQRKFFRLVSVGRWRAVPNGRRVPDAAQKRVSQPRQPIMCLQCQMLLTCLILVTLYMTSHEFQFAERNCPA